MNHKQSILFLDIETVSLQKSFADLSEVEQKLFSDKTRYQRKLTPSLDSEVEISPEDFYHKAGIWSEFGKIICISMGCIKFENDIKTFRIKSFYGNNEYQLLTEFKDVLKKYPNYKLCAHNGKEFDFPFIARRMIINKISLPESLKLAGKKPWQVPHLDTLDLWRFGDYKHYTSLNLLCYILDIPSPKQDIDGSEISKVYYEQGDLKRIVEYCQRDTLSVAQILLRMNNQPIIEPEQVIIID